MTVKELKDFINALEEEDLQCIVLLNEMEDNLSYVDKISLSTDYNNKKIFVISSEFGFYGNFGNTIV